LSTHAEFIGAGFLLRCAERAAAEIGVACAGADLRILKVSGVRR
jgi:hypothetical protein